MSPADEKNETPGVIDEVSRRAGAWSAAGFGAALSAIFMMVLTAGFFNPGIHKFWVLCAGLVIAVAVYFVFYLASRILARLFRVLPGRFLIWLGAALGALVFLREFRFRFPPNLYYPGVLLLVGAQSVLAAAVWMFWKGGFSNSTSRRNWTALAVMALVADVGLISWIRHPGADPFPVTEQTVSAALVSGEPGLDDPSHPGRYEVLAFTYGSGTDQRRPEYGEAVRFETEPVDLSRLLPEWKGFKKRMREWYWGFSIEAAPINGRVWMPVGDGPFPLALVIHGNHSMEDYSDPGYAYLGELLASRGFIFVSVDENYINGTWSGDFGGREMPARAVILLEHLRQWREWSQDSTHELSSQIDMERVALLGHSRGGEGIAIAAAYNQLDHYPDNATVEFDYGFSIRSLVAIAQIDQRYHRRVKLENVNFLTLHGSYDSDEPSYHGMRQFRRIRFTGEDYWFKAGIYLHGANHGQFNTGWGRRDSGPPNSWLLNLEPIIPPEEQRQVAKVYISAFLETTLHDDKRFLPLFRDPRLGSEWLPKRVLVQQFEDSLFQPVANFEEDIDVTTATATNAAIQSRDLSVWREEELRFRDNLPQGTQAAVLGWDHAVNEQPSFAVTFPKDYGANLAHRSASLSFSLSPSTEKPQRVDDPRDNASDADSEGSGEEARNSAVDFTLELFDANGTTARVALSDVSPSSPALEVQYLKLSGLNRDRYRKTWEATPQSYQVPLSRFATAAPAIDLAALRGVRFRFDKTAKGVVILDDIGFRFAERALPETMPSVEPAASTSTTESR